MAVGVYRYDDVGAPTLSGTAGALIGVLDHALVTGQGWSKVYSGTNLAVYRAPAGNQLYLRVDDTGTTAARIVGYETMSAVSTGTGPFPTEAQVAGGLYAPKSANVNATARNWVIVANDRFFHMWVNISLGGVTSESNGLHWMFGDIAAYQSPDAYGTVLIAPTAASTARAHVLTALSSTTNAGHWVARSYTGSGASVACSKTSDHANAASANMAQQMLQYPNPSDGGLHFAQVRVHETGSVMRGVVPGLWNPMFSYLGISDFTVLTGSGPLAGKTFLLLRQGSASALAFETSNTW